MVSPRNTVNITVLRNFIRSLASANPSIAEISTPSGTLISASSALFLYVVAKLPIPHASLKLDQVNSSGQDSGPLPTKSASGRTAVITSSASGEIQKIAATARTSVTTSPLRPRGGLFAGVDSSVTTGASTRTG